MASQKPDKAKTMEYYQKMWAAGRSEGSSPHFQWPSQQEALRYMREHKLVELFDNMLAQVIFYRPANPRRFTLDILTTLHKVRLEPGPVPCLFDESNLEAVWRVLDTTDSGKITLNQYLAAMQSIGAVGYSEYPRNAESGIVKPIFMQEAQKGLIYASLTFKRPKRL